MLCVFTGKRYSVLDVSAMLLMVVGLIMFTLADNSLSPSFNSYGKYLYTIFNFFEEQRFKFMSALPFGQVHVFSLNYTVKMPILSISSRYVDVDW